MNEDLHFQAIQQIIRQGKTGALQAVNSYLLLVNWQIGAYLSLRLNERKYGDKIVERLSVWLLENEPGLKGFDRRNLYRMRVFYDTWNTADFSVLPEKYKLEPFSKEKPSQTSEKEIVVSLTPQSPAIPPILLKLTWTHHIQILSGCTSNEERLFYLALTIKERYDVRELRRQIQSALYERQMLAKHTLLVPEHPKKDQLPTVFRDRYVFEFLHLEEPHSEYDLKKALIGEMKKFLLELGRDFLFIAEEMHLKVGMDDYFIDLVFFQRELQCLVAFDLKIEAFKPEHLGKMNFYLELLDRDIRKSHENPAIGVVLCKTKNDETVEIAMSRQLSPAMVADYQTKFVDKSLLRQLLHQWAANWEIAQSSTTTKT